MKHKPSDHSLSAFSILLFSMLTVCSLFFLGDQQQSAHAFEQGQKKYFHFVSEQEAECTGNLPEEQTQLSESVCMQVCPIEPDSLIPEGCNQQQPLDDESTGEEEQQPLDQQQQQQQPLDQQQQQQQPLDQQQPERDLTSSNNTSTKTLPGVQNFGPSSSTNLHFPTASECYGDLTGKWLGNDGGKYYIRQIDKTIWWFGFNTLSIGEGFSNVFHGSRGGNGSGAPTIFGEWQDVPLGGTKASGSFDIQIDPTGTKLTKINSNGDFFGASEWTRSNPCSRISSGEITGPGGELFNH
jgi:hypothetical protein